MVHVGVIDDDPHRGHGGEIRDEDSKRLDLDAEAWAAQQRTACARRAAEGSARRQRVPKSRVVDGVC